MQLSIADRKQHNGCLQGAEDLFETKHFFGCAHLLCLVLSTRGQITVAAALLHVMSPHQVKFLVTVPPHTLVSLNTHTTSHLHI